MVKERIINSSHLLRNRFNASKSSGIKKFSRSFIFRSFLIGFILRLCNSLIMADIVSYHTYLIIVDYCKFLRMAENGIDYIES